MPGMKNVSLIVALLALTISCSPPAKKSPEQAGTPPALDLVKPKPTPTPTPAPGASGLTKAYHISGNIDDAVQEGDVCDVSVPFTVPGTLKFEFTPTSASKGNYTYSGPFNATGSGPYEIYNNGKMLVSGVGCIMGKCADYSHDWKAKPIDPATCGKQK